MGDDPIGLEPGISVQVRLEDGTLMPATVKWTEGSLIGLAFIHLEDNQCLGVLTAPPPPPPHRAD